MNRIGIAPILVLLLLSFPGRSFSAAAEDLKSVNQLIKQGQHTQALEKVNTYLASNPKDAQARFLKGVILTEQNKSAEAIKIFTGITEDYPELPEPYNNLAVLYAAQGQYEKAKTALEMAINTHPSYATAHENLGDIFAKMASQAYDKALQLDKTNATAQTKLSMIKEIFSVIPRQPKTATVAPTNTLSPPNLKPTLPLPVTPEPVPSPAPVPATPAAPLVPASAALSSKLPVKEPVEAAKAAPANMDSASDEKDKDKVLQTVNAWLKAWSNQDATAYLNFYSKDFKPPRKESRNAWEKSRKERIEAPKSIAVSMKGPHLTFANATHATVTFKQIYHSDTLSTATRKTLSLVKQKDKWLIQQERAG